jgi:fermentation-respiration switch protein FrsA (DUF1100 family)
MARKHYPFVPAFLIRSRYDNEEKIASVAAPKLFFVAENDEVAPPEQGRRLFEIASAPKTLFVIPGPQRHLRDGRRAVLEGVVRFWGTVGI